MHLIIEPRHNGDYDFQIGIENMMIQDEVKMLKDVDQTPEGATAERVEEILRGDASRVTLVQLTFEDEDEYPEDSHLQQDNSSDVKKETCGSVNNVSTIKSGIEVDGVIQDCATPRNSVIHNWLRSLDKSQIEDAEESDERVKIKTETLSIEDDDVEDVTETSNTEPPAGGVMTSARFGLASKKYTRKTALKKNKNKRHDYPWRSKGGKCPGREKSGEGSGRDKRDKGGEGSKCTKRARLVAAEPYIVPSGERLPLETDSEWWEREKRHAYLRYRMTPPATGARGGGAGARGGGADGVHGGARVRPLSPPAPRPRNVIKVKVNMPCDTLDTKLETRKNSQTQSSENSELSETIRVESEDEGEGEGEGEGKQGGGKGRELAVTQVVGGPAPVVSVVPYVSYVPYVSCVPCVTFVQYGRGPAPVGPEPDSSPIVID